MADREIVLPVQADDLGMRSFMDELRSSGVDTGGPAPFTQGDVRTFTNQLDRHLRQYAGR